MNADGTLTGVPLSCSSTSQTGCTARNTDCTTTNKGTTCTITTDVTFAQDGSSASGLETASCTDGTVSCTSTHAVTGSGTNASGKSTRPARGDLGGPFRLVPG